MRRLFCLTLIVFLLSCDRSNPVFPARIGHIHRVVILGNSIVWSAPSPALGWPYSWGMAASAKDSDFVHLLMKDFHSRDTGVSIEFENISAFEREYRQFDPAQLDSLRGADLYIVKLAENVPDTATGFILFYDRLLGYLISQGGFVLVLDGFWNNPVNKKLAAYAEDHEVPFIRISDLSRDTSMEARGLFSTYGVSVHPSDKGMRAIEQRIWGYVKVYF